MADGSYRIVEKETFRADEWDKASLRMKKTGKSMLNGLTTGTDEDKKITVYRSATHASQRWFTDSLNIDHFNVYNNIESAINVMAHEIWHYKNIHVAGEVPAFEAGSSTVEKYRVNKK